jgi:glycosyltransferase involved in cell wall biosynthesis
LAILSRRTSQAVGGIVRYASRSQCRIEPLFDPSWYLAQNPDVAKAGAEPLTHYIQYGAAEGRNPNPFFDTRWYLAQNPDVAEAGVEPLTHYIQYGAAEGRNPNPFFDTRWYLAQNPDVAAADVNPLTHFLERGAKEHRAPHPSFDLDWSRPEYTAPRILLPDPARVQRSRSPLVSVVVPVFNKSPYLWICLSSILDQSLSDIEVICVEDGSTDGSAVILREAARLDPRVLVVRNLVRMGAASSRNAGIHLARGKYIVFTDADDVLPRDALRTLYSLAVTDQVALVRGSLNWFRGDPATGALDPDKQFYDDRGVRVTDCHNVLIADKPNLWLPWWHTTFLIDLSFVREVRASYPNLSDGEDPVFIATLLSTADRMSTTSDITYLARTPDTPRRIGLKYVIDFVRHAAMVRRIYLDRCPRYWRDGYRQFLLSRVDECFLRPHALCEVEQHVVRLAMIRADIGVYLPLTVRWPQLRDTNEPGRGSAAAVPAAIEDVPGV